MSVQKNIRTPNPIASNPSPLVVNGVFLDEYMTQEQLANEIGCSVRTLQRLQAKRTGPARIKVGRKVMYKKETVTRWLDDQEERPRYNGR